MAPHNLCWQDRCEVSADFSDWFGVDDAFDSLIGDRFIDFLLMANLNPNACLPHLLMVM